MSSDSSESGDDQPDADSTEAETDPQDIDEEPVDLTEVDPEDDEILNLIVGAATGEGEAGQMDGSDRMFALCDSAVVAPEITPERWRDMKSGERLGLTMRIAEWAGIDQMMDFPEAGEAPPQGE